jgi:hypothetical protein
VSAVDLLELAEQLRADTLPDARDRDGFVATAAYWEAMGWANPSDIDRALLVLVVEAG